MSIQTVEVEQKARGTLMTFRGGPPAEVLEVQADGTLALAASAPPVPPGRTPLACAAAGDDDSDPTPERMNDLRQMAGLPSR